MRNSRRSLFFFVIFIGLVLFGTPSPAQAQLGVAGGLNFESADNIQTESAQANFESSTGYHVGIVYEFGLGPLNFRPGFFYRRVGEFDLSEITGAPQDSDFAVSAFEIPVDVRVSFLPLPLVHPYVLGGPKITIPRGEDEFGDAVDELSYTFNVGIGAQISIPASSIRLQPELRYEFGATGFIKEESVEVGGVTFTPQDSPQFSTFALRLNVLF